MFRERQKQQRLLGALEPRLRDGSAVRVGEAEIAELARSTGWSAEEIKRTLRALIDEQEVDGEILHPRDDGGGGDEVFRMTYVTDKGMRHLCEPF